MKRFLILFAILWSICLSARAQATSFTDLKFSQSQIADSQWNVSACMYTATCQIYSTNPGTMYTIPWWNGQWNWQSGQYVQFATTSDAANPYEGKVYNSNGSLAGTIGTGHIINMGVDSSGKALFFFVGNDNNTGQLFSANYGMTGSSGYTWTGTLNPTTAQVNTFATSYGSTTPLSAGQTYTSSSPTVTGTSTTYTYRSVVTSPGVTSVYRTPVTTTTYSDGTSTSSNGTEALYQTKVASTVTTNTISGTTLTTINTPINTVTPANGGATFIESNGSATTTSQTIQQGLNFQVWRYDPKNYTCVFGLCAWNFTYHTPSTNRGDYGNPVNSGRTTNGIFIATNSDLPNNDNSLIGSNDGTVMRYYGTITAPVTTGHPAGSVYRLYFYNNTDDGFVLRINGGTIINQNQTQQLQSLFGYTDSGWMNVVAGQTYNIEAWYWNTWGSFGQTFFWDYGAGRVTVPNSAFTTGTIVNYSVDTTGVSYSDPSVVNITGYTVNLGPTVEGGTITMTNSSGQEVVGSGAGSTGVSNAQQSRIDAWNNGSGQNPNNYLYIEQISGDANTVSVTQTTSTGKNHVEATIAGAGNNNVSLTQTGTNYLKLDVNGAYNNITSQQSNNSTSSNFKETTVTGNNNIINTTQKDNANKIMFNTVTGSNNSVTAVQEGVGNHYLENVLTGNGHTVLVNQSGSTANNASINVTNSGGAANVDVQQSGGKSFNLIQGCTNPAGCTTVVRQ